MAGLTEAQLRTEDAEVIMERMVSVKKGFVSWMNHTMTSRWVQNARDMKLKNHETKKEVVTFNDLMKELESNPRMESFVRWYDICCKDTDVKNNVRNGYEKEIMDKINLKYHDDSTSGGCVGDLILEVQGKIMEQINNRSRSKQGLHLVKSKPIFQKTGEKGGMRTSERRNMGDFYIVRSDANGKAVSWKAFNVSEYVCWSIPFPS